MTGYYGPRRYGYGPGLGWRRGPGWDFGRGYGGGGWCWWTHRPLFRGWGGWGPPPWALGPYEPEPYWQEPLYGSQQEEMADLKEQEGNLRGRLAAIHKCLDELEKESSGP
jgi:hypothetical protein